VKQEWRIILGALKKTEGERENSNGSPLLGFWKRLSWKSRESKDKLRDSGLTSRHVKEGYPEEVNGFRRDSEDIRNFEDPAEIRTVTMIFFRGEGGNVKGEPLETGALVWPVLASRRPRHLLRLPP